MATLDNNSNISGSIGNYVYYKLNGKQCVRRKPGKRPESFKTSPSFDRVRKNMVEFGKAIRAAALLKNALGIGKSYCLDPQYFGRLSATMLKVLKSDTINPHGARSIMDGNLELLENYTPYKAPLFKSSHGTPYQCSINKSSGQVVFEMETFNPKKCILELPVAKFFQFTFISVEVDFGTGTMYVQENSTPTLERVDRRIAAIELKNNLVSPENKAIILALRMKMFNPELRELPGLGSLQILRAIQPD
jgi:hypothetical protein